MSLLIANRVRETTLKTGTGSVYVLEGAVPGFKSFAEAFTSNDETVVFVVGDGAWEAFVARVVVQLGPDELERVALLDSSTGSAIDWPAGEKQVFMQVPAERVVADQGATAASEGQFLQKTGGLWVPKTLAKADVGLGSVENHPIASQGEAEAGTANDRYMTPLRTAQAIAELAGGGGGVALELIGETVFMPSQTAQALPENTNPSDMFSGDFNVSFTLDATSTVFVEANVLLALYLGTTATGSIRYRYREGSTNIGDTLSFEFSRDQGVGSGADNVTTIRYVLPFMLSGVSAGSKTWKFAASRSAGGSGFFPQILAGGAHGPSTIRAYRVI